MLAGSATAVAAPTERRAITVDPASGPAGSTVTVSGTGWDPAYYTNGVEIGFYQNFGNGVLTSYADRMYVKPDAEGRFRFDTVIPSTLRSGDVVTISGLIGNGGGERANFTVTGGAPPTGGGGTEQADLAPTAIRYDQNQTQAGTKVFFDSGIANTGGTGSGVFNIKWFVDGREVGAYGSHDDVAAGTKVLDGNSQFEWTFDQPGTYDVSFFVDADDFVAESDEANNRTSVQVTVGFVCVRGPNGGCNGTEDPKGAELTNPLQLDQWQIGQLRSLAICAPHYFASLPAAGLGGPQGFALFITAIGEKCAPLAVSLGAAVFESLIPCVQRYGLAVCTGQEPYRPK
ncbi:MAG: CARDB domain-containing protein [Pseudonocardia sp.]